eukprot:gene9407-11143_t
MLISSFIAAKPEDMEDGRVITRGLLVCCVDILDGEDVQQRLQLLAAKIALGHSNIRVHTEQPACRYVLEATWATKTSNGEEQHHLFTTGTTTPAAQCNPLFFINEKAISIGPIKATAEQAAALIVHIDLTERHLFFTDDTDTGESTYHPLPASDNLERHDTGTILEGVRKGPVGASEEEQRLHDTVLVLATNAQHVARFLNGAYQFAMEKERIAATCEEVATQRELKETFPEIRNGTMWIVRLTPAAFDTVAAQEGKTLQVGEVVTLTQIIRFDIDNLIDTLQEIRDEASRTTAELVLIHDQTSATTKAVTKVGTKFPSI